MQSIRIKLIALISILFLFIGVLIYVPLSKMLPRKITVQILKRDLEIAKHLSREVRDALLTDDQIGLSLLLNDYLKRLEDAQYLFIQSPDGTIPAHTFQKGFPRGLINFNPQMGAQNVKEFLNRGRTIYDIAVPILDGSLGMLHLGVSLESGKEDIADITKINYYVGAIIIAGLGVGIVAFLITGFIFSNRIIELKNFAIKVGDGDLGIQNDIVSKDEIGVLAQELNEMSLRLKEKVEEIKQLHIVEERSRIAFDLHDGCAQDMASIIKRIELSKKLFAVDQNKAFEELESLKEHARGILNKTRDIILDLKTPEDHSVRFTEKLKEYFMNYENENHITIKSAVSESVDAIIFEKTKAIFYIIKEALNNIRKHSRAKCAEISLQPSIGQLEIHIKDDGRGFNVEESFADNMKYGNFGLSSMRQRAIALGGTFHIDSVLWTGTDIYIYIPLTEIMTGQIYEI